MIIFDIAVDAIYEDEETEEKKTETADTEHQTGRYQKILQVTNEKTGITTVAIVIYVPFYKKMIFEEVDLTFYASKID